MPSLPPQIFFWPTLRRRRFHNIAIAMLPAWSVDTPPLGVAYIASALRREGYGVRVHDYNVSMWHSFNYLDDDLWDYGKFAAWEYEQDFHRSTLPIVRTQLDTIAKRLAKGNFDAIGFSVFGTSIHTVSYVVKQIRRQNSKVRLFLGGPAAMAYKTKDLLYSRTIDAVVFGEGEETVVELIRAWERGKSPEGMPGVIVLNKDGHIVSGCKRKHIPMDDLPIPSYDDYELNAYRRPSLPIMMSRGCVGACTFCTEKHYWKPYRSRSPELIVKEIKQGMELYGVRGFLPADSLLNGNHRNLEKLARLIIDSGLSFSWGGYARVDKRLTAGLLDRMAKAGCKYLSFGLESGSQKILDLMNKRISVKEASRVIKDAHMAGIKVHLNLIIGFPGETEQDLEQTIDFIRRHKEFIKVVNTGETLGIAPEMSMWKMADKFGLLTNPDGTPVIDEKEGWISADRTSTLSLRRQNLYRVRDFLEKQGMNYQPRSQKQENNHA